MPKTPVNPKKHSVNNVSPYPTPNGPKPNSLSKRFKGASKKKSTLGKSENKLTFYHAKNDALGKDAPSCLIIGASGYLEYGFTQPFYWRNEQMVFGNYVEIMGAYPAIVNPVNPDGSDMVKENKNRKSVEDPQTYKRKVIVIEVGNTNSWKGQFEEFFEETLKPLIFSLHGTRLFKTLPTVEMTTPPVVNLASWSHMLSTSDILSIVDEFYCKTAEPPVSVGEFFKQAEDNIYALWEEGKVPVQEVIGFFKLKKHHLRPKDWENYEEEMSKGAEGTSESDSENDNAVSAEDDGTSSDVN